MHYSKVVKKILINTINFLSAFGIDVVKLLRSIKNLPRFLLDYYRFQKLNDKKDNSKITFYPVLTDYKLTNGFLNGHYFRQDLYVSQKVFKRNPDVHLDVGSRIDGFVAQVAAYRKIYVADVRPNIDIDKNIISEVIDFSKSIPRSMLAKYDSVSCLHALEHFGLGRYGDKIEPKGHKYGIQNFSDIMVKNGILYLSVPIGKAKVAFNAHRVLNPFELHKDLKNAGFLLLSLSIIDDAGQMYRNYDLETDPLKIACLKYGCGIFECQKL